MRGVTGIRAPSPDTEDVGRGREEDGPLVRLGKLADGSVAPSVYVLVRYGSALRPQLAESMRGSVALRFGEGYAPVRIDFCGDVIDVSDDAADEDRACDLVLSGRLADVNALVVAPLAGGLPKPTTRLGRSAIARLADGRVDFDGPLSLGRALLRLLAIDPVPVSRRSAAEARSAPAA